MEKYIMVGCDLHDANMPASFSPPNRKAVPEPACDGEGPAPRRAHGCIPMSALFVTVILLTSGRPGYTSCERTWLFVEDCLW